MPLISYEQQALAVFYWFFVLNLKSLIELNKKLNYLRVHDGFFAAKESIALTMKVKSRSIIFKLDYMIKYNI